MDNHAFLINAIVFLAAAVLAVPIFRRFGLASALGYLAAGSAIGPSGLKLVRDVKATMGFAEFGVVLLLFVIGLELKPSRLWVMRKSVFGLGGAQVALTSIPFIAFALFVGQSFTVACAIGVSLAFSSTAFALQMLAEKKQLGTQSGRCAFAILLFQDLVAIPVLALMPVLAPVEVSTDSSYLLAIVKVLVVMSAVVFGGRYLLRPAFRAVAAAKTNELFTMAALLLVFGVSLLMESIGLSMALGAFLSGILLADSEYRHELEADIEPFKGLLLGLFFMAVGMTVDYGLILRSPLLVLGLTLGLMLTKVALNLMLGLASGLDKSSARHLAVTLPQAGEFGFVIFGSAVAFKVLPVEISNLLVVVVTLSMALTPLFYLVNERYLDRYFGESKKPFDSIESEDPKVIIAGIGRFGQIVSRTLRVLDIKFTALEADTNQVEVLRKFGTKVHYGDASKLDLLKAAGAAKAKILVIAIDDVAASLKTAEIAKQHFPNLKIFARARNRQHAYELLDLGIDEIWRETLGTSIEMTEHVLMDLGFSPSRAAKTMAKFKAHDERMLREQHRVHRDELKLVDLSKQSVALLIDIMKTDEEDSEDIQPLT